MPVELEESFGLQLTLRVVAQRGDDHLERFAIDAGHGALRCVSPAMPHDRRQIWSDFYWVGPYVAARIGARQLGDRSFLRPRGARITGRVKALGPRMRAARLRCQIDFPIGGVRVSLRRGAGAPPGVQLSRGPQLLAELGDGLEEIGHQAVVGDLEDGGLGILVDRHDHPGPLHSGDVLHRTGDAGGDVQARAPPPCRSGPPASRSAPSQRRPPPGSRRPPPRGRRPGPRPRGSRPWSRDPRPPRPAPR